MPCVITFELCLQLNHLSILLQKVPHNNNRMTETCDILKQRSTELKGFKVHLMSTRQFVYCHNNNNNNLNNNYYYYQLVSISLFC